VIEFEHVEEIDRPPDEVFAYVTDLANLPRWQSGVLEASVNGELRVGATVHERRRMLGRELTTTLEVSEYEPGRRFSLRALSGPMPFEVRHSFAPAGRGTRLVFQGQAKPPGLPRLAQRLLKPMAEREFRGYFETLKQLIESGP
jgi:carbon monoxide dehydrogenase subunit G